MSRALVSVALAVVLVAGSCGSGTQSPERVVRAWNEARSDDDDEAAAALFAPGARVVAGDYIRTLRTHHEAVAFSAGVRWCGPIVWLATEGKARVMASFAYAERANGAKACRSRNGSRVSLYFEVRRGKIVLLDFIGQ